MSRKPIYPVFSRLIKTVTNIVKPQVRKKPHFVIILNGLNNLTNGATAKTLYGEKADPSMVQNGHRSIMPMIASKGCPTTCSIWMAPGKSVKAWAPIC
jgi:hypothetical protein